MAHAFESASRPTVTLSGNVTLTVADVEANTIFVYDPAGARDLTLPDAADVTPGTMVVIANQADEAEVITVKADGATVCTPTQAETAVLFNTGSVWVGLVGANS